MFTLVLENNKKIMAAGILFLAVVLLLSGNAQAKWFDKKDLSRSDSQGPVTVTATFISPEEATNEIRFKVKMDTHSVDLDQYRLEDLAFIRFDRGEEKKSLRITRRGGGHHVTNILRFAGPVPKGSGEMFLILRNIGGVDERTLQWKLPGE